MSINIKARQQKMGVGTNAGEYMFVMTAEIYNRLSSEKVIEEAHLRSGIPSGQLSNAWSAIGEVIKAWATEGHSVAVPGLGTMRYGVRAKSVKNVEDVGAELITARRVVFIPCTDIKNELKETDVNITCYDKDGKVIKEVKSDDNGSVEDGSGDSTDGDTTGGDTTGGDTTGGDTTGGGSSSDGDGSLG